LKSDILFLNVESGSEADLNRSHGSRIGKAGEGFDPDEPHVDPKTHPYISTGMKKHKFGVGMSEARELYLRPEKRYRKLNSSA